MARRKRIWYPGAIYHVMSRGNHKASIFNQDSDCITFLEYLKMVKEMYPFELHAICLMTNHFHMLIETKDICLSRIMHKLLSLYAEDYNYRYDLSGHLFEGRYTACLVEGEEYFLEVSRYIHLNPVKANMVKNPYDYPYSSFKAYSEDRKYNKGDPYRYISNLVDTERTLGICSADSRNKYIEFVEDRINHNEQEQLIQKDIKDID